ncbi:MAG: hypothetical protein ACLFWG_09860 [Longimicrobiales bacterium]
MNPTARTRLASMGVLFLVLATGFLLGLAWERTDGLLRADESSEGAGSATTASPTSGDDPDGGPRGEPAGETGERRDPDTRSTDAEAEERGDDGEDRRLIVHRVGITPEQEARVDSIVDIHGDRVRALRREMKDEYDPRFRALRQERDSIYEPHFEAVLLQTRRSIRSVLSEEQAVRYDSLLSEHDRKEAERERRKAEEKDRRK